MADSNLDDLVDQGLARYLPPDQTAAEQVVRAIAIAADLLPGATGMDPGLGAAVKGAAMLGVWLFDRRKVDRVFPLLLALKDRIRGAKKKEDEYVRKAEFKDLFEETLRRIADQPEPERQDWLRNIFLKVIDHPKDHAEHRLFLRLVDELSSNAHKVLTVLKMPIAPSESLWGRDAILAQRSGVPKAEISEVFDELARFGLIQTDHGGQTPNSTNGYLLTRLGRDFLIYRSGTT